MHTHPPPKSYFSPKVKIGPSLIHGKGLMATENIAKDEIIGVKDGYIIDKVLFQEIGGWTSKIGKAVLQISDNFYLGPLLEDQIDLVMMHVNHSCNPTIGFLGNCISVAVRDIKAGEELAVDYAMWLSDADYNLSCACGAPACRHSIKGIDWQIPKLQEKYESYFSSYLQKKIDEKK